MATLFSQAGNWLLLAGVLLFVLAVFNAARAGRRAREAAYYGIRQQALNKTRRWAFAATIVFLATGALVVYRANQPSTTTIANTATSTPVLVSVPSKMLPTSTPTPTSETPVTAPPTVRPKPTATRKLTATPTMVPTATPPNLPDILRTPLPSAVTAAANAQLSFTTLASVLDNRGNPVDRGQAFPGGTRSVRLYFQAANVNNGATWGVLCYKGDQVIDSVVDLWKWGPRQQGGRAFCSLDGSPGKYRAVAYLGAKKQFEVGFELLPPTPTAAVTVTTTPTP